MILRVQKLVPTALLPSRGHPGDAGLDLYAVERTVLEPGESRDIRHGIAIQPPDGHWSRIVGRSSAHRRLKLRVLEGIIDHGYRGELYTYVTNESDRRVMIDVGDRISQLIVHPLVELVGVTEDLQLEESSRGTAGFGSTGGGQWLEAAPVLPAYTNVTAEDYVMADPRPARPYVYLGGPIDFVSGHRDRRHLDWNRLTDIPVYCPECTQISNPLPALEAVKRNMLFLLHTTNWAVFVWGREFSIGTPIEVWEACKRDGSRVIIVDPEPRSRGLFEERFREEGVRWVRSLEGAAEIIRREHGNSGYAVDVGAASGTAGGGPGDGDGSAGGGDAGEHPAAPRVGAIPPGTPGGDVHGVLAPWEREASDGPNLEPI